MTTASNNALNARVRGCSDRAITELQSIGLSYDDALGMLVRQVCIRIDDNAVVRKMLFDIISERSAIDD
jgi:hypothetical protein